MRMLLSAVVLAVGVCSSMPALAGESDYEWQQGFGQGHFESWVTSGPGNEIRHMCQGGSSLPNQVSFQLNGHGPADGLVYLDFGHGPDEYHLPGGRAQDTSTAGRGTFQIVSQRLARYSQVRVSFTTGESAVFTLRRSGQFVSDCTG